MRVLIVNGYNCENKIGKKLYLYFVQTIRELFISNDFYDVHYIQRDINELSDYIVDWEHEQLHFNSQMNCERFDELDFIFIGGDLSVLPWEPKSTQVVTLIHMAKYTRKPLVCIGYGAFCAIYTLATKGVRYNILNGPHGGTIDSLSEYPNYAVSTGAFPSGWLDHETGDIYTYDTKRRGWMPVCNTGIHFVATAGRPVSKQIHAQGYEKPHSHEKQTIGVNESDEDKVQITNLFLSSPLINNLPLSRQFPVRIYQSWYLNRDSALPKGENLLIMGDGKSGPNILLKDRIILLASRLEPFQNIKFIKSILDNYLKDMKSLLLANEQGKIDLSLNEFLFGRGVTTTIASTIKTARTVQKEKEAQEKENLKKNKPSSAISSIKDANVADHTYDTYVDRQNRAIALSKTFIPTTLKNGPVKIDPPVLEIFYKAVPHYNVIAHHHIPSVDINDDPSTETVNPYALLNQTRKSTVGKRPKMIVQNPLNARKKRLELAFQSVGIKANSDVLEKSVESNTYENSELMPEYHKDLLSGLFMKENSITQRRHHFQPGGGIAIGSGPGSPSKNSDVESPRNTYSAGRDVNRQEEKVIYQSIFPRAPQLISLDKFAFAVNAAPSFDDMENTNQSTQGTPQLPQLSHQSLTNQMLSRMESPHSMPSKPTTSVTFKETKLHGSTPEVNEEDEEKDNFSLLSIEEKRKQSADLLQQRNAHNVPVISDWFKIFEQQDAMRKLIEEAKHSRLPTGSQTERNSTARSSPPRNVPQSARTASPPKIYNLSSPRQPSISSASTTTSKQISPKKPPSTARSSAQTPRTIRTANTCKNVSSLLATANQEFYLPIRHPKAVAKGIPEYEVNHSLIISFDNTITSSPLKMYEEVRHLHGESSLSSQESLPMTSEDHRRELIDNGKVVFLPNQTFTHKSNYLHLTQKFEQDDEKDRQKEYQGLYSEPYVSMEEKKIKEYNKAKEKFIAGNFRTMFHHDTLELRKEGQIRPFSEYPKYPGYGYENLTAADWNLVKTENKELFLAGAWKK